MGKRVLRAKKDFRMLKTIEGRWGQVTYFAKDIYIGQGLRYYGEFSPDETEMILSLAVRGKACLDIGANIGCISQALLAKGFRVHAFEPQPVVAEVLWKNLVAVGGEFTAHNIALGAEDGEAQMPKVHYSEKSSCGSWGLNQPCLLGHYPVPVTTLDSYNFKDVGLIKIDVEGFEQYVLQGGRETILREKPIMYIEDDRPANRKALRAYIRDLGYSIEEHQPPLYRKNNFKGYEKNIWDRMYVSENIICRPC